MVLLVLLLSLLYLVSCALLLLGTCTTKPHLLCPWIKLQTLFMFLGFLVFGLRFGGIESVRLCGEEEACLASYWTSTLVQLAIFATNSYFLVVVSSLQHQMEAAAYIRLEAEEAEEAKV